MHDPFEQSEIPPSLNPSPLLATEKDKRRQKDSSNQPLRPTDDPDSSTSEGIPKVTSALCPDSEASSAFEGRSPDKGVQLYAECASAFIRRVGKRDRTMRAAVNGSYYSQGEKDEAIAAGFGVSRPNSVIHCRQDILASNAIIYGRSGSGVTYRLLDLGHFCLEEGTYLPVYFDLEAIEVEGYVDLRHELELWLSSSIALGLVTDSQWLLNEGVFLFLIDNLDRATAATQKAAKNFIESLNGYPKTSRVVVGARSEVYIDSTFSFYRLAPWDAFDVSSYLDLDAYELGIRKRILEHPRQPDFLNAILEYRRLVRKPCNNLASIYRYYLEILVDRLKKYLPIAPAALKFLLQAIADSREYELHFSDREWYDVINTIIKRESFTLYGVDPRVLTPHLLLDTLINTGIMTRFDFDTFGFCDPTLHCFLIALSYTDRDFPLDLRNVFDAEFFEDKKWHPVALFFVELQPPEDVAEVRQEMRSLFTSSELGVLGLEFPA